MNAKNRLLTHEQHLFFHDGMLGAAKAAFAAAEKAETPADRRRHHHISNHLLRAAAEHFTQAAWLKTGWLSQSSSAVAGDYARALYGVEDW